ncbi:MAG: hypothetical protein VX498_08595 [Myxococcota bacterium]|nr:hypothetical protein [Myxococcota bacterium]
MLPAPAQLRLALTVLFTMVAFGCSPEAQWPTPADYDPHPEPPSILRDVALINDEVEFTQPFVPGHRTTMDGRVALRVQGGPPGVQRLAETLSFYLLAPERLEAPILDGPPGPEILADLAPVDVLFPPALEPGVERLGHHAICDPSSDFPVAGEQTNPYLCGPDNTHDCYDFTVINTTSTGLASQLWGTAVTVEVSSPKTPQAQIVDVSLGEPVAGRILSSTSEWTEPAVTRDGRLLTGRYGRFPRSWTHPQTGETMVRPYDLAYSVLPPEAEPCDITAWTDFHPMSHAPYDPAMIGRYGLAAYPFRDSEGALIPDGEDLGGTYPWVDREGANVFMTGVHGRISEQSETRFPRRCVVEGCEAFSENIDWDRGFLVAGLWTHGKFVHLDGMVNNIDWAVGVTPSSHWMVDLYRDSGGNDIEVRFGSGRFLPAARAAGGPYPAGYTHNANILDSIQNLANHQRLAQPITPRDVVWVMSSGVATDEIAFDDFVDPNAFILSNMQASITQLYDGEGRSLGIPKVNNGQVRSLEGVLLLAANYELHPEEDEDIHLQNAATSLNWEVPSYGLVDAGTGRVEPVALGGVQGRGFWLSGTNEIRYAVPAQPRPVRDVSWYMGIFIDPRYDEDEVHSLFQFPDGSGVRLLGRSFLHYLRNGEVIHEVALPETEGWIHLGWQLAPGGRDLTLLVDGFPLDRLAAEEPLFGLIEGDFVIGQAGEKAWGFRGWIDDLHVLAHGVTPEVACNHARGTLVRWEADQESSFPDWAHAEIAAAAGGSPADRYSCFADHSDDYAAHLGNLPEGASSVRDAITFPEGPLRAGAPRPDSTTNPFCLSCHHAAGQGGLGLEALVFQPGLPTEDDPRRQPLQPPRRVFGNIPAGWIPPGPGAGSPSEALQAPEEGLLIDPWLLPSD